MEGLHMKEIAGKKYTCSSCGSQLLHNAARGMLVCESCGSSREIPKDEAATGPQEYDLEETLRSGKFHRGWGTELRPIKCRTCGAVSEISLTVAATECPFCGSTQIIEEKPPEDVMTPETVIPFAIDRNKALSSFGTWLGSGFASYFRPSRLKGNWRMGKISGMYLPFWTFDADTYSTWTAMAGYYYEVEERDSSGKIHRVRQTRWEPADGSHAEFYDDELVFASRGLERLMVERIYPFDMTKLVPYKPEYMAGWGAERYTVGLQEGWETGKGLMFDRIVSACGSAVPGDTHRDLDVRTSWRDMTFKHVLLPVWVANYDFGGKVYRFLVNGESGRVHGEAPISWYKVSAAVFVVLVIVLIILLVSK
ncbi:MAG: zinc ribbon domain-containing protein [Thermodesulfovibrio sp.]|nr:zinc ribbon domain-containing protein [Thermodesulfovibrio sp.]